MLCCLLSLSCVFVTHLRGYVGCAASIPVVGFNAVLTSEHFGSFLTFGVLHAALLIQYIKVRHYPFIALDNPDGAFARVLQGRERF